MGRVGKLLVVGVALALSTCTVSAQLLATSEPLKAPEAEILHSLGLSRSQIAKLGADAELFTDLLRDGIISGEVCKNLCLSWLGRTEAPVLPVEYGSLDPETGMMLTPTGLTALPPDHLSDPDVGEVGVNVIDLPDYPGSGPYYKVVSTAGAWKMTAYVTTPTSIYVAPGTGDTPYLYHGIQTSAGMMEAGLQWNVSASQWRAFCNSRKPDGTQDWRTQTLTLPAPSGSRWIVTLSVTSTNHWELVIASASSGTVAGRMTGSVPSSWNFSSTNSSIQVRYVSAVGQPVENLYTTTHFLDAHWQYARCYRSTGYEYFTSTYTYGIGKYPNAYKVYESWVTQYHDLYVDIVLQ